MSFILYWNGKGGQWPRNLSSCLFIFLVCFHHNKTSIWIKKTKKKKTEEFKTKEISKNVEKRRVELTGLDFDSTACLAFILFFLGCQARKKRRDKKEKWEREADSSVQARVRRVFQGLCCSVSVSPTVQWHHMEQRTNSLHGRKAGKSTLNLSFIILDSSPFLISVYFAYLLFGLCFF